MKITIVVGGRWHAFDLARELHQAEHLHKLITNYPRWFVQRCSTTSVSTLVLG